MVTGIIGRKIGMTQVFAADGAARPVTVLKAGPCIVIRRKESDRDGYEAVQLGLVEDRPARVSKPVAGLYVKANVPPTRIRREVALSGNEAPPSEGDQVDASLFAAGDQVDVIAVSRGRGFQGVMSVTVLRWRRDPRLDVPPRTRIDRPVVVPVARPEGDAGAGPHGERPGDGPQPARRRC